MQIEPIVPRSTMPKLTIITVNFNNADGLKRTLNSVVEQQGEDIEFLVIDGASTDGSLEEIKEQQEYISSWISEPDKGVYNAMNKAIGMATGEYVLFLNSGDHFAHSKALKQGIHELHTEEVISFNIQVAGKKVNFVKSHPEEITQDFLFENTLAHQSTFIKKSLFTSLGLYNESLKIVADWAFFLKAILEKKATYKRVDQLLTVYYLDGMSAKKKGIEIRKHERDHVLRELYPNEYDDYLKRNPPLTTETTKDKTATERNQSIMQRIAKLFK